MAVLTIRNLPDHAHVRLRVRAAEAVLAAALLPKTRDLGLSLADHACLALAITRGLPVLTADTAWATLDVGAVVQVIR